MNTELIIINEYCSKSRVEPSFIVLLEEGGLIDIQTINGEQYIPASQLRQLEKYSHLYYDLSINIEGIDAIRHMLDRIEELQSQLWRARRKLNQFQHPTNYFLKENE